jgi:hypothetical protein
MTAVQLKHFADGSCIVSWPVLIVMGLSVLTLISCMPDKGPQNHAAVPSKTPKVVFDSTNIVRAGRAPFEISIYPWNDQNRTDHVLTAEQTALLNLARQQFQKGDYRAASSNLRILLKSAPYSTSATKVLHDVKFEMSKRGLLHDYSRLELPTIPPKTWTPIDPTS